MARTVKDAKLDTRNARLKLPVRREPHWRTISEGLAIGYRRGSRGGTWIARHYTPETGRRFNALGTADDVVDADGVHVLSFSQAQEAARTWFAELARTDLQRASETQSYTVANAMDDYMHWYRRHRKAAYRVTNIVDSFILPALGTTDCSALTTRQLRDWHEGIADAPPRARTRPGQPQRYRVTADTLDGKRARRNTANRILNVLKAALNHSFREGKIETDQAWRRVKPFRGATGTRVRYLSDDDARRLVEACVPDFRPLVQAALLTGARLGELVALIPDDFNADTGTLHIQRAKSGKGRHIVLSDEGRRFFETATADWPRDQQLFLRATGRPWAQANTLRPLLRACSAAGVDPAITFHELRHTYASRLAMRGVPLQVIAEQLGHADTRITQRHYAHLSRSYIAEAVRAAFSDMGIVTAKQALSDPHTREQQT